MIVEFSDETGATVSHFRCSRDRQLFGGRDALFRAPIRQPLSDWHDHGHPILLLTPLGILPRALFKLLFSAREASFPMCWLN
jgi:hypothetical protein